MGGGIKNEGEKIKQGKGNFIRLMVKVLGFSGGTVVKNSPRNTETPVQSLVWEDPTGRGATKPVCHNC